MSERPKPPDGYKIWIEYIIDLPCGHYCRDSDRSHAREELEELQRTIEEQSAEIKRLKAACMKQDYSISQVLGRALGFPKYADDPKNFPDAAPDDQTVCTGEDVAETLAALAADMICKQAAEIERLTKILDSGALVWDDNCGGYHHDIADIHPNLDPDPLWVIDLSRDARNWRDELEKGGES